MRLYPESTWTIAQAATCIQQGGVCIFPTETFFGVGGLACDAAAVARVYQAKARPVHRPLPVIVADRTQLERIAFVDTRLEPLMARFWPGPLAILLPARARVPMGITAGTGRIAVRISSHQVAHALALAVGEAIASSSANISGHTPVTRLADVDTVLLARVDGALDACPPDMPHTPQPSGNVPSTLVEIVGERTLRILRAGAITQDMLCETGYEVVA